MKVAEQSPRICKDGSIRWYAGDTFVLTLVFNITDENGNPIYSQYAIWYFKIPGYVYNEKNIIPGKPISVHFNSGALSGREFELSYTGTQKEVRTDDGEPFVKDADDYEILFIEEGSYIIPAITGLIPNDGDEITLFNIVMPEQYKQSAYDGFD